MKSKSIIPILLSICFLSSLLSSCGNLSIPKSIKVKTKAEYNFTVAKLDVALSDYVSADKLIPETEDAKYEIYDYNPSDNTEKLQEFMLRMPIQEIPLDFESYLNSTDIGDMVEATNFSQSVTIPETPISYSQVIDTDDLSAFITGMITIEGNVSEYVDVEIIGGTFDEMTYKSGEYIIKLNSSDYSGKKVSMIKMEGSKETVISSGTFNGYEAKLNIAGKKISGTNTKIKFDSSIPESVTFVAGCPDGVISKITGLTVDPASNDMEVPISTQIDTSSLGTSVESITFGNDCYLNMNYKLPEGWSGISFKNSINLSGALDLSVAKTTETSFSLEDKVLTPGTDIDVTASISTEITNATLDFSKELSIEIAVEVKTLKQIVLNQEVTTDLSINQGLPAEATNMIKEVVWNAGTGIKVTYTNTFPAGNDFGIKNLESVFFNIPKSSQVLSAQQTDKVIGFYSAEENTVEIKSYTKIDLSGSLELPGETAGKIVMKNVAAGETYELSLKIEPILDWKSIKIGNNSSKVQDMIKIDFNKKSIFSALDEKLGTDLSGNLNLRSLPIYLFCDTPGLDGTFTDPKFYGEIKMFLGIKNSYGNIIEREGTEKYILEPGYVTAEKEPVLSFTEDNVQTTKITGSLSADIKDVLNDSQEDESIFIYYDMLFSTGNDKDSITIEKDKIASAGETSIKLTAILILPLDIDVGANQTIDVMKIAGRESDKDLFGRDEAPDNEKITEYLRVVKSVGVSFKPTEVPFIFDNPITVNIDMDGAKPDYSPQYIGIGGGSFELESPGELINVFPLTPTVTMTIPVGRLAIKREAAIISPINVCVKTNGCWDIY